jgi:hypothetical protein
MKLNKAGLAWAIAAILVIFSILAWLFWGYVSSAIVVPIYYLIWLAGVVLKSIPQALILGVLVLVCLIIGWNTLTRVHSRPDNEGQMLYRYNSGGRYLYWNHLFANLRRNPFFRDNFAYETRRIILSILAYQEGVDMSRIEQMVAEQAIDLPESVWQLIQTKKLPPLPEEGSLLNTSIINFRRRFFNKDSPIDQMVIRQAEEIIHFIEYRLEISHDE